MAATGLEARYRRLLRWYPADHRSVHRDEMLGVLMAAAEPGQDWPRLRDSADVLMGAARIRIRPGRTLSDANGWRDALAVYSLAFPVLMLAASCLGWLAATAWSFFGHGYGVLLNLGPIPNGAFENVDSAHPLLGTLLWLLLTGQAIIAILALAGWRRGAAVAAALYTVYFGSYVVIYGLKFPYPRGIGQETPLLLVAPLTTLVALLASAGPKRGRQLMRPRHWACLAAGSVAGAALMEGRYLGVIGPAVGRSFYHLFDLATTAAVVLGLVAAWLSSAHGKRLAVLFGVPAFSALLELAELHLSGPGGLQTANTIIPACELLVPGMLAAIIYRTWRRGKSAASGPGGGAT